MTSVSVELGNATLGTPEQAQAERLALQLLDDPEILALIDAARQAAQSEPLLDRPGVRQALERGLKLWTVSLILREAAGDYEAPAILWVGDTTPRTWFGHVLPGAALAGDNPDAIYRHGFIDGGEVYELTGQVPDPPPAEFSIEPLPGLAGVIPASGSFTGKIGVAGGGPAMLTDRDLTLDAERRFRVVFGGEPPTDGSNHMRLPDEPIAINTRDVLSDWTQRATRLKLTRLSPPKAPKMSPADIRAIVIAHLPAWLNHWRGHFKDNFMGGFAPNTYKGPAGREGAWSFILAGRFALEPGQVAVLTARSGGAGYHGFQVASHWQVSYDNIATQSSLNAGQATPNTDGWVSYVIAPHDPGVANWLDTNGELDGVFVMRWQLFGKGFNGADHVKGYEVLSLEDLAQRTEIARLSPARRAEALAQRARTYATRFGG